MKEAPLPVVISALISDGKILLIKRIKGSYVGMIGLPGGKIEKQEHVSEAAIREIQEEAGISCLFKEHVGFVSEHLVENGRIIRHFLLHVCELTPSTMDFVEGKEGKLGWYDIDNIESLKDQIIPSDYPIIEHMIKKKEKTYYNCVVEKVGSQHHLRKFD